MNCAFCQFNDGCVYTSIPPQYRCTIDNEFHFGDYECDKEFAPVKHGHWEYHVRHQRDCVASCSVCKKRTTFFFKNGTEYCPFCGAKMDEEEK